MRFSGRTRAVPEEIAGRVRGKVLAVGELHGGGWLVLTRTRMMVAGTQHQDVDRPWHMVDRGEWTSEGNRIRVTWVDGADPTEVRLLADDRELAAVLREQVESALVHAEVEQLPGGGVLRGTIRRDEDGTLFSQVSASGNLPSGPALQGRVRALENRVRDQVGLPPARD